MLANIFSTHPCQTLSEHVETLPQFSGKKINMKISIFFWQSEEYKY